MASGRGQLASFTVIRRAVSTAYADEVPYVLALIDLAEGPRMMSSLTGVAPADAQVGMAVEVVFEQWSEEITVPRFRPAAIDNGGGSP